MYRKLSSKRKFKKFCFSFIPFLLKSRNFILMSCVFYICFIFFFQNKTKRGAFTFSRGTVKMISTGMVLESPKLNHPMLRTLRGSRPDLSGLNMHCSVTEEMPGLIAWFKRTSRPCEECSPRINQISECILCYVCAHSASLRCSCQIRPQQYRMQKPDVLLHPSIFSVQNFLEKISLTLATRVTSFQRYDTPFSWQICISWLRKITQSIRKTVIFEPHILKNENVSLPGLPNPVKSKHVLSPAGPQSSLGTCTKPAALATCLW